MITYDMRIAAVRQWLKEEIFTRFTAPQGADPKLLANDTVELVNKSLPNCTTMEQFKKLLDLTRDHMQVTARSRTLPVPKDIKEACRLALGSGRLAPVEDGQGAWRPDTYALVEKAVRNGNPISDHHLSDVGLERLFKHTTLTREELEPYITAHLKETTHE
jgi:hypothetical protein